MTRYRACALVIALAAALVLLAPDQAAAQSGGAVIVSIRLDGRNQVEATYAMPPPATAPHT